MPRREERLFAFPFLRGRFLESTASWSSADRWRYWMALCDQMASASNRVPLEAVRSYWRLDRARMPEIVRLKIREYTVIEDGVEYLRHPTATHELQVIADRRARYSALGQAGNAARWGKVPRGTPDTAPVDRHSQENSTRRPTDAAGQDGSVTSDAARDPSGIPRGSRGDRTQTQTYTQTHLQNNGTPPIPPGGAAKRVASARRKKPADSVSDDDAKRYVTAWNEILTTRRVNPTAANLLAAKRAQAGGLRLDIFARALVAVRDGLTPLAKWCGDRGLRFDQMLRVEHRTQGEDPKPGVAFRIDDELEQKPSARRGVVEEYDGSMREVVIGDEIGEK